MYIFTDAAVFAVKVDVRVWQDRETGIFPRPTDEDGREKFLVAGSRDEKDRVIVQAIKWHGVTAQTNVGATMVAAKAAVSTLLPGNLPATFRRWEWKENGPFCGRLTTFHSRKIIPGVLSQWRGTSLHVNSRGNFFFGGCQVLIEELLGKVPGEVQDIHGRGQYGWRATKVEVLKEPPQQEEWWQ